MRSKYFDNAKGILIIFIIFAHVFSACADYYGYTDDFFKFCSLFMIQCFFFISAYFSSKSKRKRKDRLLNMVKIYIVWQMLITFYYAFVLKTMHFSFNILYPRYTYWFLLTTIIFILFEYVLEKVSYKVAIPFTFTLALVIGFVPQIGEFASLARTFTFLPFYTIGFYAKDLDLVAKLKSPKYRRAFITLSFLILVLLLFNDDILPYRLLRGKYSYYDISGSLSSVFIKRCIFYLFSLVVSIAFFKIIPDKETIFTKLGQNTLYVYLTQGAILRTLVTYGWLFDNEILGTVIVLLILILLTVLFGKIIVYLKTFCKERGYLWIRNLKTLKSH